MTQHLFLVTIGPIQDFIAAARRSRDLWFGSWLLSELSKAAARCIQSQGGELIFPAPQGTEQEWQKLNVANKILAKIDMPSEKISTFGKKIEDVIYNELSKIRDSAYSNVKGNFDKDNAHKQVADLVEYYWVALQLGDDYAKTRQTLEALMAARKVTRNFQPVCWGNNVPKSSLDGQRESVITEDVYKRLTPVQLHRQYGIREGERLCGVGLLKRNGYRGEESRFMSTSHMAALTLLQRMPESAKQAVETYVGKLKNDFDFDPKERGLVPGKAHPAFKNYDGQILFEERLGDYIKDVDKRKEAKKLEEAKKALRSFLTNTVGDKRPQPYYALLLADGDKMGKVIDNQKCHTKHQALSKALADFAGNVSKIVEEECQGSLIYAGGDDVLALVPLHTVLKCAHALAEDFKEKLKTFFDKEGNSPTLSVGIAIAHHLDPISDGLDLARKAEKEAKKTRNALAVIVSKRSGSDRTVAGTWGTIDQQLEKFIQLHCEDKIPHGAAYELVRLADDPGNALPFDALQKEAVRILRRKRTSSGEKIDSTILKPLVSSVQNAQGLKQLADTLIIARFFADAQDLATGK